MTAPWPSLPRPVAIEAKRMKIISEKNKDTIQKVIKK
jgi:hypothetical protein